MFNNSLGRMAIIGLAVLSAGAANAAKLDLSQYELTLKTNIAVREASAITYNWDTDSLFVVGDEAGASSFSKTGVRLSDDLLGSGFSDTEAVTYLGGGNYALGDERTMVLTVVKAEVTDIWPDGMTRSFFTDKSSAPKYFFGDGSNVGNIGLEGASYDPTTGHFFAVKERGPQAVWEADINFGPSTTGSQVELFDPALLGLTTLSDIQVLSTVPGFAGSGFEDNLLILSTSSLVLLEVTRAGEIVSSFDLHGLGASTIEGVTIDLDGNIYLAAEDGGSFGGSSMLVLSRKLVTPAVPEPATWAMMVAGLGLAGAGMRRRKISVAFG